MFCPLVGVTILKSGQLSRSIDPALNMPNDQWLDTIEDIAEEEGYFEPLGPDHSAAFVDRGSVLLVTFETMDSIRDRAHSDVPMGWELIEGTNWSQLCILSDGETWFRHRAVYQYFDQLVDDAFFDGYDKVVFYGANSCGYGAAAYSVVAPGAAVICVSPQATLDPRVTGWDDRYYHMRRHSFTDRYGYAPDMLEACEQAFVLFDPNQHEDAMHASLFTRSNVTMVRTPNLNGEIETFLRRMEILRPLLDIAFADRLAPRDFHNALRARRSYLPYLRMLLSQVEAADRPFLTALLCRSALDRINIPRFHRQLAVAKAELEQQGRKLPAPAGAKAMV